MSADLALKALDELHRKGLIHREKGRGSHARSQHIDGHHCLTRVRCVDDRPVAFEETCLDVAAYPGIDHSDVESGSLYATMRRLRGHEQASADAAIEPGRADETIARHLGIKKGAPVVVACRVTSSEQDEVLEYARAIYRGDGFALTVRHHKIS